MQLSDLLASVRSTLDDAINPPLWTDTELTRWLNNAVREVCIRARLLKVDAVSDPKRCLINVTAGQPVVKLDPSILVAQSGILNDKGRKLWALPAESLDLIEPEWDNGTSTPATPRFMIMDLAQKTLRLWPTPDVAYVLRLRAWRTPVDIELMESGADEPVVQIPDPEDLKHWACYEAYLKQGAETYDTQKAQTQLGIFESRFGARPNFHEMARWADSPPRIRHARMF